MDTAIVPSNFKICNVCGKPSPDTEFRTRNRPNGSTSTAQKCKQCERDYINAWRKQPHILPKVRAREKARRDRNIEKTKAATAAYLASDHGSRQRRSNYYLKTYGITYDEYLQMSEEQGNCCYLCGRTAEESTKQRLAVDHCHITGKVRRLLCGQCNLGIGALGDRLDLLRKAVAYLEAYS